MAAYVINIRAACIGLGPRCLHKMLGWITLIQCASVCVHAAVGAGANIGPTLTFKATSVTFDSALPRPLRVLHNDVDLSPPAAVPGPEREWWLAVNNEEITASCDTAGSRTASSCTSTQLADGTTNDDGVVQCANMCNTSKICAGWNMIKDTPTSGQRGKPPLCTLIPQAAMPSAGPFYHNDPNFVCGSKSPLQPDPPSEGRVPVSQPCIGVVQNNGSTMRFCSSHENINLRYTVESNSAVSWILDLQSNGVLIELTGSASLQPSVISDNITELVWTLSSVSSAQAFIRSIDVNFAFMGVSMPGAQLYTTRQQKSWCPPGEGCQEWSGSEVSCTIGSTTCSLFQNLPLDTKLSWSPPTLPWAFQALQKPGRSAFVGAVSGNTGFAAYSTQPALPFQVFADTNATALSSLGAGAARIQTNLRCGNVLPYTIKFGLFSDISGDNMVSDDDAVIYSREQYPVADSVYRSGVIVKLDSDITSYSADAQMPRISFNDTMGYIKTLSSLIDNQTLVVHLVGWQSTGHDTGYPTYDIVNSNLGGTADLFLLAQEAKQFNTIVSYHINVDEAYENITVALADNVTKHPVPGTDDGHHNPDFVNTIIAKTPNGSNWLWGSPNGRTDPLQGGAYHISKTKDAVTGLRWQRLKRFLASIPVDRTVHSDAYRDINDSWEKDERGFIAEDEEAICGLQADSSFWASHNLSFGVEGSNGCLVGIGPVPAFNGITDYYWHGESSLGTWNRIVMGTTQGLDQDICAGGANWCQTLDWDSLALTIYTKTFVYSLRMTDMLLSNGRYSGGGNATHWPYGGGLIQYIDPDGSVFLPAVQAPPPNASKSAPTTLSSSKIRVFSSKGGDLKWTLPLTWAGKTIVSTAITKEGRTNGPAVYVNGSQLTIASVAKLTPIILELQ